MTLDPFGQMTPCKSCPFRTDHPPTLRPGRTREIEADLKADRQFICHNRIGDKTNCAGSLIVMTKLGLTNNPMRMGGRLGLFDPAKLNMTAPVYESFDAMEAAMCRAEREWDEGKKTTTPKPSQPRSSKRKRS